MDASRPHHLIHSWMGRRNPWGVHVFHCWASRAFALRSIPWENHALVEPKSLFDSFHVKKMDTSFTFQWDTEILKYFEMIENFRLHWKVHKTPGFFYFFCCRFIEKFHPCLTLFWVFVLSYSFFPTKFQIQGTIFVVLLQALPRVPSVKLFVSEKNGNKYRDYDEKRWGKKVSTILITNCFTKQDFFIQAMCFYSKKTPRLYQIHLLNTWYFVCVWVCVFIFGVVDSYDLDRGHSVTNPNTTL